MKIINHFVKIPFKTSKMEPILKFPLPSPQQLLSIPQLNRERLKN